MIFLLKVPPLFLPPGVVLTLSRKGHFSPVVAAGSAITLFASHAAALVANSV